MPKRTATGNIPRITAVDIFCGAGGLTRGLLNAGISVAAGYDIDEDCRYPYEHNNAPTKFHAVCVTKITSVELAKHYSDRDVRVLVGCAPCVPFSRYTQGRNQRRNPKWGLLREFARLVRELKPDIVSMENVAELQRHSVCDAFLDTLDSEGFYFANERNERVVYCPDYGIAQERKRLVVVASRLGPIQLIPPTHHPSQYRTVSDVVGRLDPLRAGEVSPADPLHRAATLSPLNLQRIRKSKPGGSWRDWPRELVAKCHTTRAGRTYPSVYGRMDWERPAPTITTQFFGFGNGRFGHPDQDRAISLREGAILQSFPKRYAFVEPGRKYHFKTIGRMIGNAVPVRLGEIVGRTIVQHVREHGK